jgi:hypothetical protein
VSSESRPATRRSVRDQPREPAGAIRRLIAGGTEGNERLTVLTGLVLIVLLAILGVTIVRIGQLLWLHMFLGMLLVGPVVLKLVSTGYRFARYYTHEPAYRQKGPPATGLRLLGPLVVLSTLVVFGTGVALLILGPSSRQPLVLVHKVSFFAWIAVTALHVLGHLPEVVRYLGTARDSRWELLGASTARGGIRRGARSEAAGAGGRAAAEAVALLLGLALALALLSNFGAWTH